MLLLHPCTPTRGSREVDEAALQAMPDEQDPDLAWEAPGGPDLPDLPYDGEIPADVTSLAEERRHTAS